MKDAVFYIRHTLNLKGKLVDLKTPAVMGILNLTPDSFYDGGKLTNAETALKQAEKMLQDGATILDIGGYSTRPNAQPVSETDELNRILPAIKLIKKHFPDANLSVDTFRTNIAAAAINEGVCMINDASGGSDNDLLRLAATQKVAYVLMHTRGTPQDMMQKSNYQNIMNEMIDFFHEKIDLLHSLDANDILIDVGFGFAKTLAQNHFLLQHLSYFKMFHKPLLVGLSRKSMIYKVLETTPAESLNGTTALHALALAQGASVLRVHDVKEAVEMVKLLNYSPNSSSST